ncbi:transglutaminase TgpA family protein [Thalassotalea agarivorans]|uniref:Transglutaminase-like enzyme, putative cysteine protease n=1 Tax=Thalassotalea agarivorans TaxID=349064 RepID=A0A1I0EXI8_THASX|nr:DUF3488 and transglutaminase-like domain-containing protein [Thalassotalea agarivorans]SET49645.1 Transglutaminase-like enzyme, putative cysteine protease [Thalassotalea agarivorans]
MMADRLLLVNVKQKQWLVLVALANILLVLPQIHWSILLLTITIVSYQFYGTLHAFSKQARVNKLFSWLAIILIIATGYQQGILISMVQLLTCAYCLKLGELNKNKDLYQFLLLGFFVLAACFIFYQSLWIFGLTLLLFVLNTTIVTVALYRTESFITVLKKHGRLFAYSLPLAFALFFLFPKLSPFWQVPLAKSAKTGLSDSVKVGDIANLALSNELAFRVEFKTPPASQQPLYWRAMTLDQFDGSSWRKESARRKMQTVRQPSITWSQLPPVEYQVIAQPSFQTWLFSLDYPNIFTQSAQVKVLSDASVRATKPIVQRVSYGVASDIGAKLDVNLSERARAKYLALPQASDINPRLRQLGQELSQRYTQPMAKVEWLQQHFSSNDYFYTLTPQTLANNSLDQFYFETKEGFCEHYASTFTFIMRAAGVPARLVTGYLGAELNEQGQFYRVLQRDAHAWSEIWIEGQGWQRVDPTGFVAPERVLSGFSEQLTSEQNNLNNDFLAQWGVSDALVFLKLKHFFESLDYQWSKWVVSFDNKRQNNLLQGFMNALSSWQTYLYVLVVVLFVILSVFLWRLYDKRTRFVAKSKEDVRFEQLQDLLAKHGDSKETSQTVSAFCAHIAQRYPPLAESVTTFASHYNQLKYRDLSESRQKDVERELEANFNKLKQSIGAVSS